MPIIENVVLNYTKIKEPGKKYQSDLLEWSVDAVVSREQAKAWNKEFQKQKAKEFDNEDYLKQFKADSVPFPDQDSQYVIKLKRGTTFKSGDPLPEKYRPRVFLNNGDGTIKDITKTTLVGNGSRGVVQYDIIENTFGKFAKLGAVRVDSLVEYKGGGTGVSELGTVVSEHGGGETTGGVEVDENGPDVSGNPFNDEVPF